MKNIVVCIKQVPDTQDIKWSESNNIVRDGMLSILNPQDEFAINCAVELKKKFKDLKITALSMGPNQAQAVLKQALALGCDEAVLLCDKNFIGSDTLATGKTIASAIKEKVPEFDIILCGQYALDGDTAQTGAGIANFLNTEQISWVNSFKINNNKIIAKQELEEGYNIIETETPCVVCMMSENVQEKMPKIQDYIKAQDKEIKILNANDIKINPTECGIKGSPTWVSAVFRKQTQRKNEIVENFDAKKMLQKISEIKNNE